MSDEAYDIKHCALIALGNPYMGDDAIALLLAESIHQALPENVDLHLWPNKDALFIAAELMAMDHPAVIIDCADMGLSAGSFRCFKRSECQLVCHFEALSSHSCGFAEALALIEQLGFQQDLYFFAIQPLQTDFEQPVSRLLIAKLPVFAEALLKQLQTLQNALR